MGVTSIANSAVKRAGVPDPHCPPRPFSTKPPQAAMHRISPASARRNHLVRASSAAGLAHPASSAAGLAHPPSTSGAGLVQLLKGAVDFVFGNTQQQQQQPSADDQLCMVSYGDGSSRFTPMSAAARIAFAALEQDDYDIDEQRMAALGALCLVTYSEEDEGQQQHSHSSASSAKGPSAAVRAFGALNNLMLDQDGSSMDGEGSVMETLCIVSYDEA